MAPNRGIVRGVGLADPFPSTAGSLGGQFTKLPAKPGQAAWVSPLEYDARNYGIVGELLGVTDQTVAMNNLCAYILAQGGGTLVLPFGTVLCNNSNFAFTPFPFTTFNPKNPYLRIRGRGQAAAYTDAVAGASILDLRYNGTAQPILTVTATGGTYTLWFNGLQTASINFNDVAATIQTRLRALAGGGALTVTGTNPFTISGTGSGLPFSVQTNSLTGGSATITNNPVAKMDLRGAGELELDHFSIISGGTDDYPICQITNTTVYAHDLYVRGHSANSGTSCVQDAFYVGPAPGLSGNSTSIDSGASDAAFQGYGTVFERIGFDRIRVAFRGFTACNGVPFNNNVIATSCGGDATHGAFTFGAAILAANQNTFFGNIIECTGYVFPFVFTAGANDNRGFGNGCYDPAATTLGTLSDAGSRNRFYGTHTEVANDYPDVNSLQVLNYGGTAGMVIFQAVTGFTVNSATSVTILIPNTTGFLVGGQTQLQGVGGTNINGTWRITAVNTNVSITVATTNASGTTASGGAAFPLFTASASGTYRITLVGSGGSGGSGGTPTSALANQAGGSAGSQGSCSVVIAQLTAQSGYTFSIGASAAAPGTTLANGHAGANGNNGAGSQINIGALALGVSGGHGGNGGGASSTAGVSGGNSPYSGAAFQTPAFDGGGGAANYYGGTSASGGAPVGYGAGGGGGGGSATTTNGGGAGGPGSFGNAAAGNNGGSGSANGVSASAAAATSYGAGGGGGGAGATAAGTGGAGGASGPGAIFIEGPFDNV